MHAVQCSLSLRLNGTLAASSNPEGEPRPCLCHAERYCVPNAKIASQTRDIKYLIKDMAGLQCLWCARLAVPVRFNTLRLISVY